MSSGSPAPREHHSARLTNGSQRPARAAAASPFLAPETGDRAGGVRAEGELKVQADRVPLFDCCVPDNDPS